jgi:SAM-dependent methyltransferase
MSLAEGGFVKSQYDTSDNLDARTALHARFSTNPYGWFRWVYDQFDLRPGNCVLELGCGTGELWARNAERLPPDVRFLLTDLSQGMLDRAAEVLADIPMAVTFAPVDAQQLPYPDGRFDVVIANHMLFHVPDRAAALNEIARVLAPGGRFYATTIGQGHMSELRTLAGALGPGLERFGGRPLAGFTLEDGPAQVARVLEGVEVRRYPDALHITTVEPLLAYYQSMGCDDLAPHVDRLRQHLQCVLAAEGVIALGKDSGMILAHKPDEEPRYE